MKKKLSNFWTTHFLGLAMLLSSAFFVQDVAAASCSSATYFGSGTSYKTGESSTYQSCSHTPSGIRLKIYEVGLCKQPPTPADKSSCSTLFTSPDGTTVDISKNGQIPLSDAVTLDEGSYGHVYLIISSTFSSKAQIEFNHSKTAIDNTVGTVCFTNGNTFDEVTEKYDNISCTSGTPNPLFSEETLKVLEDTTLGATDAFNAMLDYTPPGVGAATFNLYLLDSNKDLSTRSVLDGSNNLVAMSTVDRPFIFGHQILNSSVKIDPDGTNGINVGISVTDGVEIGFVADGGIQNSGYANCPSNLNGKGCIADLILSGFKFNITTY